MTKAKKTKRPNKGKKEKESNSAKKKQIEKQNKMIKWFVIGMASIMIIFLGISLFINSMKILFN